VRSSKQCSVTYTADRLGCGDLHLHRAGRGMYGTNGARALDGRAPAQGWTYSDGPRNDVAKTNPHLVPWRELPEETRTSTVMWCVSFLPSSPEPASKSLALTSFERGNHVTVMRPVSRHSGAHHTLQPRRKGLVDAGHLQLPDKVRVRNCLLDTSAMASKCSARS